MKACLPFSVSQLLFAPAFSKSYLFTTELVTGSVTLRLPVLIYGVRVVFFSYRFTQIAVDPQVKVPGGKTYDVLFIGTGN